MDQKLEFVTKELIDKAVLEIDKNGIPVHRQGTGYAISINNKNYPFKLLVTEAARLAKVDLTTGDFSSTSNNRQGFKKLTGYPVIDLNGKMTFKNLKELVDIINSTLGDFCSEFQYKRKELLKMGSATNRDKLFINSDDSRDWVINPGGGTEFQYHLFLRNNIVCYGLGFNTQYVPFANKKSPVEYIQPFVDSFLAVPELYLNLKASGFDYIIGDASHLQNLVYDDYILIGKKTDLIKNGDEFELSDTFFQEMINNLKGILFQTYKEVVGNIETVKKRYSFLQMEQMFKDYLIKVIPKSVNNYLSAVATINRIGLNNNSLKETLYEVQDIEAYNRLMTILKNDAEYIERNKVGHSMFSSSLKKYKGFLNTLKSEPMVGNNLDYSYPLNQILFGPPGTGKTYHTINKSLSIVEDVDEEDLKKESRSNLINRFDDLLINDWENPSGQIAFVTFHQSMTYEDFIEGIKPVVTANNKVIYDTLPGIFKNMCAIAKENWLNANSDKEDILSFEDAFNSLKENWEEERDMKFPMKTVGKDYTIIGFTKSSIQFKKASGSIDHTLSISTLRDYFYGRRVVRPTGVGIYYPALLNKLKSYQPTEFESKEEKKYVLIIDEINRGNVSQIFGELITLIEEDKRLGNNESLEVTLPYSKESFGVPPNLYIIGTMNTADRSIEALDTALRRRFSFEEIPPNYSLSQLDYTVYNYKASELLKTINSRIEKLLDKDHTIGHSYFMVKDGKNETEELIKAFYKNIIPLLQEYFFGDFGKIGLVLGKGFVNKKDWDKKTDAFADFDHESSSDFEEKDIYEIIDYRNREHNYKIDTIEMSFDKAIQLLMKGSIE